MSKEKSLKTIKLIKNTLIGSFILLIGCSNPVSSEYEANLSFDMRLPKDSNGYYHLEIDREKVQTLHRVSGYVGDEYGPIEAHRVEWESNLYWYLGDTLGYVVKRGLTDNLEYVSYDTVYITGFNGMEVPTSNKTSFSNSRGELNNMIAPIQTMVGDTMKLTANWHDGSMDFYIVLE